MDDLNEETTLEFVLGSLRGRRLYSRRAQEKSCFRVCDRFRHPLGYPRFEALVRRGEEPEGVFEEGFLKTLACYLPALEDPTKAKGMPGFAIVSRITGVETAQKLALAHNAHFIQRMMRWGVPLIDYGIDIAREGGRSVFYAMESSLIMGYEFLETMFFWGGFR